LMIFLAKYHIAMNAKKIRSTLKFMQ